MQTRRNLLASMLVSAASPLLPTVAFGQSLCEVWDKTLVWDVKHSLWGTSGASSQGKVVYLIGAPWCPFCRRLVNEYLEGRHNFELRFIPIDVVQRKHREQQADIVINKLDGLKRTFVKGDKVPGISPAMEKLIHDANFIAQEGLKVRFTMGKGLVSPTVVYEKTEGTSTITGYKPLTEFASSIRPMKDPGKDLSTDLEQLLAQEKQIAPGRMANLRRKTAIHALPNDASASVGCVASRSLKAIAECNMNGQDWLKVEALVSLEHEPIYGYIALQDAALS
ncbi:thiol-disulfide isomerase/thioredoxin [Microvirga lupini]|uniref:Thiol-disulfide isomerase/thioredoxin n=1 Tax=Microvirga lupini TaxID=420324 RepID=A0A7W4VHX9_9HYPH|nr:hypothetical protein [Microvirga lupini]MBB3017442.1 thiol-disulfide isomerase/thioredoxin [Microvirga lupini]